MPDGMLPQRGDWNRFTIALRGLARTLPDLPDERRRFLNDVVTGVSGKQIPLKDPPTTHRVVRADLPEATTLRSHRELVGCDPGRP